jgi:hypothetical protein
MILHLICEHEILSHGLEYRFSFPICSNRVLKETPCSSVYRGAGSKPPPEADARPYRVWMRTRAHPNGASRRSDLTQGAVARHNARSAKLKGKQRCLRFRLAVPLASRSFMPKAGSPGASRRNGFALAMPAFCLSRRSLGEGGLWGGRRVEARRAKTCGGAISSRACARRNWWGGKLPLGSLEN